ncbi:hypothetical protein R3I94_003388 [Phoxinus phoxinus]
MHCCITVPDHWNNTLGCGIAAVWRVPPDCSCLACVYVCASERSLGALSLSPGSLIRQNASVCCFPPPSRRLPAIIDALRLSL